MNATDLTDGQIVALHNTDGIRMNLGGHDLRNLRAGLITTTTSSRYTCYGGREVFRALTPEGERAKGETADRYAAIMAARAAKFAA